MGWWSSSDKDTGDKVSYKQSSDKHDGAMRHEKITVHKDGSHSHEVLKVDVGGGLKSLFFGEHGRSKK